MKTQLVAVVRIGCHKEGCTDDCATCKPQAIVWETPESIKREEATINHGTK